MGVTGDLGKEVLLVFCCRAEDGTGGLELEEKKKREEKVCC